VSAQNGIKNQNGEELEIRLVQISIEQSGVIDGQR
jgi:hypothetical protein